MVYEWMEKDWLEYVKGKLETSGLNEYETTRLIFSYKVFYFYQYLNDLRLKDQITLKEFHHNYSKYFGHFNLENLVTYHHKLQISNF